MKHKNYGHWVTLPFNIDDHFGFVYVITNMITGRKYIGCKQLWSKVTKPPLKGRKNKRHSRKESDWKSYTGSSKTLNEDIDHYGDYNFHFAILEFHNTKWDLKYAELCCIVQYDALRSKEYYNGYIGRIGRPPNEKTPKDKTRST